jgi:hypothetical protein
MSKQSKIAIVVFGIITLIVLTGSLIMAISRFFDNNRLIFSKPVEVKFNQPVRIEERKPEVIKESVIVSYPGEIDTPIKKYICDKFGPYTCKVALAIVESESNFNELAINVNTNGSVDLGCWQINFPTHKGTISPKDAFDCYKATDWAFEKYKRDGNFNAWVGFTSGSFKAHL